MAQLYLLISSIRFRSTTWARLFPRVELATPLIERASPLNLAPPLIRTIAGTNPLAYTVDAARELFNGDFSDGRVLPGFVFLAITALLALWWAANSFRRAIA